MEIRPASPQDLSALVEIDGTIESADYLHVDQLGQGLLVSWKIDKRPLREKLIEPNPINEDGSFLIRQIVSGAEDGLALIAEHERVPVALLVARPDFSDGTLQVLDMRVDYDHRREGLATAMLYHAINHARESELRAVRAHASANNIPGNQLLLKCAFDLSGIDTRRHSNHDVVKESATLIWYAMLD